MSKYEDYESVEALQAAHNRILKIVHIDVWMMIILTGALITIVIDYEIGKLPGRLDSLVLTIIVALTIGLLSYNHENSKLESIEQKIDDKESGE